MVEKIDSPRQPSKAIDSPRLTALSLGSNLGDRHENLTFARGKVADLPRTRELAFSSVYETEPVDAPAGSPNFFNAVMLVETALAPLELLRATQAIENERGRMRSVPNAPRTLDIDILFYGDVVMDTPELTLPHPRAHLRRFVMEPLAEILPNGALVFNPCDGESTLPHSHGLKTRAPL